MKQRTKYIHIRHWDYWRSLYLRPTNAAPSGVEFSLTDDRDGQSLFFHFDLYNLTGLQDAIGEEEFSGAAASGRSALARRAEALRRGEAEYFLGGLYYRSFAPDLAFCNQPLSPTHTLLDLRAPSAAPYYAVLFLAETRPLTPQILACWMTRLSRPLFGQAFSCAVVNVPSREEALGHGSDDDGGIF